MRRSVAAGGSDEDEEGCEQGARAGQRNQGISVALFLLGAAIAYIGMLVRRRDKLMKERERAA